MLSLNNENINYVMTQILKLSCVSFSYVSIRYVLAFEYHWFKKVDANLHQFTLTKGGCTKIKLMQKAPSNGILHQLNQNYILLKLQNLISKTWNFLLRKMKFSIKNMKFSIKNMKFSSYEICQNSSFVLFVTEFSYHMQGCIRRGDRCDRGRT